ncbi:DUF6289 family protein [Oligoflexus tunisiensis]|uniref:DUF6289 family protein n=1 Tax=Oligoflexus tunisiensis TaxID=708132 RepID=UPI00350E51DB
MPPNEVERVYYSDATYTKVVGSELFMTCYGRPNFPTLQGKRTRYVKLFGTPCNSHLEAEDRDVLDFQERYAFPMAVYKAWMLQCPRPLLLNRLRINKRRQILAGSR